MTQPSRVENQIRYVTTFQDLVSSPFNGEHNATCWTRKLIGDFSEIVKKIEQKENITEISEKELHKLQLSEQGQLAREILLNDLQMLQNQGASPALNLIKHYDRDEAFFSTDVYSFHVDCSPIPIDTFLCTYYGEPSEILPNSQAQQKILIPEIRNELKKLHNGTDESFESFLRENFFDLHYQAKSDSHTINLGCCHLWKIAVEHPKNPALPCIHRAPKEKNGQSRLLIIC